MPLNHMHGCDPLSDRSRHLSATHWVLATTSSLDDLSFTHS